MSRKAKLYPPGTVFEKEYKGTKVKVKATKSGFLYDGKMYETLQDAVSKITKGKKYPAGVFFGLYSKTEATGKKRGRKPKDNGVIETTTTVETTNLNGMIQSAIRDAVKEKVEELFRS